MAEKTKNNMSFRSIPSARETEKSSEARYSTVPCEAFLRPDLIGTRFLTSFGMTRENIKNLNKKYIDVNSRNKRNVASNEKRAKLKYQREEIKIRDRKKGRREVRGKFLRK